MRELEASSPRHDTALLTKDSSPATFFSKGTEFDEEAAVLEEQYGPPRAEPGQWASCLRIIEPVGLATTFVSELDNNEAVTSMAIVNFAPAAQIAAGAFAQEPVLVVGTARGLKYLPTDCDGGSPDFFGRGFFHALKTPPPKSFPPLPTL